MKNKSYLYEIPLFHAALLIINYLLFPLNLGFADVEPHPFWSGVLIFAFRYGLFAGFFAGVMSAGAFLSLTWFFGERYLFDDVSFYFLPGCFVLVGILLGAGIERYREKVALLTRWKSQLMDRSESLEQEIKTQHEVIQGLEKRIVTKMSTLITLYEGARQLETNNLDELYTAIVNFIAKTLDAEEVALYLKTPDAWELKKTCGWSEGSQRPQKLSPHEGLTGMAGMSGKVLSVRDILHKADQSLPQFLENQDSLLSGPLCLGENGEVVAVVSIQSLDFLSFNSATVNLFRFLMDWASRSLGRVQYISALRQNEIIDPDLGVYTQNYFLSRATEEFNRSRVYYLPLSVAMVRVNALAEQPQSRRRPIVEMVSEFLLHVCRSMDVVARLEETDVDFGILMITTSRAQAEELKEKILDGFRNLGLKSGISLSVEIASFTPQSESIKSLISQAKEDLAHAKTA